jgi:hypothetical protein
MSEQLSRNYIFLDTEVERQHLIDDIASVRRAVLQMVDTVPESLWYEPRYHGWSLAAMLAHLHLSDNLTLLTIQLALVNIRFPIPANLWDGFNDVTARIFRQRLVPTTVRGIIHNEPRIADFIQRLPVGKFSKPVYDPPLSKYLTVEQALQEFFVYHWHGHLKTLQEVDGIHYEPPEHPDRVV